MKSTLLTSLALSPLALAIAMPSQADAVELDTVTVSADFRNAELQETADSISVIDTELVEQRNARHMEDLVARIPNMNYSAGSSRGKYYQIRGIGERSQFVEPLNPSVGTYVDGVDFTGFAGAATLLDVEQVEVLRGSQGTRFGANALAGVVNVKSAEPGSDVPGYIKLYAEDYNGYGIQLAHGGAITDKLLYRAAIGKSVSDGFIENTTLDKKNTNNIDELSSRLKLRWLASENLSMDLTALYLDIDNGYDAFSLDENRKTRSDEPGHDRQESKALTLNSNWKINDAVSMEAILASSRNDIEYGYDEDWTDPDFQPGYQAFDNYQRDLNRDSIELRWLSGSEGRVLNSDWLFGLYHQTSELDLTRDYTYDSLYQSEYQTNSSSLYFEINTSMSDSLLLNYGLRYEQWNSEFEDSLAIKGDNDESLLGGMLSLEYSSVAGDLYYASITRGYKAGGFNGTNDLPDESNRSFDTEFQWNYELGTKLSGLSGRLNNHISVFYIDRKDLQLKSSTPVDNGNGGVSFIDFTANAGEGFSYGLELETEYLATSKLSFALSLGLLETEITQHNNPDQDQFSLEGRETAHAPEYTYATSAKYNVTDQWFVIAEVEGRDEFYYSDSHNFRSEEYDLVNAKIGYDQGAWQVALYGKNLTNESYGTRGFAGWDADPRSGNGFDETEFEQLGSPTLVGIEGRYNF